MRRREHRAGRVEDAGGVVHHVGGCQPEVDDVEPLLHHTPAELGDQLDARLAHVASDEHPVGVDQLGETDAEGVRDSSVELVGHRPPDVVRLDDFIQY